MNSSQLKPILLRNLMKLFEIDPSPKAWGEVESFASHTQGATKEQVVRMIEHLSHEGLINHANLNTGMHIAINDKGMEWLKEHDDSREEKSLKSWLIKPIAVAVLTACISIPLTIYITNAISNNVCQDGGDENADSKKKP